MIDCLDNVDLRPFIRPLVLTAMVSLWGLGLGH